MELDDGMNKEAWRQAWEYRGRQDRERAAKVRASELERGLLATVILDRHARDPLFAKVNADYFSSRPHTHLWRAIKAMHEREAHIERATLLDTLVEYDGLLDALGGEHELDALAVGLDEALIDVVRHRKPITGVGDPEAIILEVGRELFTTRRLGPDTYARALATLGKTNLVDLIDLMGRYASTGATLTAFNQQMPMGWRQSLPLSFTYPDDIHLDSRSRLPLRPGPYRTSVSALYGRMASPGGIGPFQIRAYGQGLPSLESRVGERLMMLAILVTARAHDSQYDWTMHEPPAVAAGLQPEVIEIVRHRRSSTGLDENDAALVDFARELFTDYNVAADTYARAARAFGETDLVDLVALMGAHAADAAVLAAFDQQLPEGVDPRLPLP